MISCLIHVTIVSSYLLPGFFFSEKHIEMFENMMILSNGSLQVASATLENAGNYSCLVTNRLGADEITHHLVVKGARICKNFQCSLFYITTVEMFIYRTFGFTN